MNLRLLFHVAAGHGGHDGIAGIEDGLPVFPADAGRAQESDAQFFHKINRNLPRPHPRILTLRLRGRIPGRFPHPFQNHVGQQRLACRRRRIPDQFAVFFRRIAPGRLAGGKPLLAPSVPASPSKTGMSSCVCNPSLMKNGTTTRFFVCAIWITIGNARAFFQENRVDLRRKYSARGSIPPAARWLCANFHFSPCHGRR